MCEALGIISFAGNHIWVEGLHDYRPVAAFSFLGRYRVVDFPISNMSNSGDTIFRTLKQLAGSGKSPCQMMFGAIFTR